MSEIKQTQLHARDLAKKILDENWEFICIEETIEEVDFLSFCVKKDGTHSKPFRLRLHLFSDEVFLKYLKKQIKKQIKQVKLLIYNRENGLLPY
jgi:hypothetical protein